MLEFILILQALCGTSTTDQVPLCSLIWKDNVVVVTGFHGRDYVKCKIVNTADAECIQDTLSEGVKE